MFNDADTSELEKDRCHSNGPPPLDNRVHLPNKRHFLDVTGSFCSQTINIHSARYVVTGIIETIPYALVTSGPEMLSGKERSDELSGKIVNTQGNQSFLIQIELDGRLRIEGVREILHQCGTGRQYPSISHIDRDDRGSVVVAVDIDLIQIIV